MAKRVKPETAGASKSFDLAAFKKQNNLDVVVKEKEL